MLSRHLNAAPLAAFALSTGIFAAALTAGAVRAGPADLVMANLDVAPASARTAMAVEPQSALGDAIKAAVSRPGQAALKAFYAARGYEPFWLGLTGEHATSALLDALDSAGDQALPASLYGAEGLRQEIAALHGTAGADRPAAEAAVEIALSRAMVLYGAHVSAGFLEPRKVDGEIYVFPERPDALTLLTAVSQARDVGAYLAALAPRDPGYARLVAQYAAFRDLVRRGGWSSGPVPDGPALRYDDRGPRVAALRARLTELGDFTPVAGATMPANRLDAPLEEALKVFQRRHGLNDDGVVGRRTLQALNTTAEQRMRQIAVNLERMRWTNRDPGKRHITVNQADFRMELVDDGRVLQSSRVVIGKNGSRGKFHTPEFSDEMTHVVVNPVWNVPKSIATKEILPLLQEDPSYLLENNMMLVPKGDEPAPEYPELVDWTMYSQYDFPFLIKQRPGGDNALGRVKFIFPNKFDIYLHDTPSKNLFNKDVRAYSHGCIRVQDPFDLAYALLAPDYSDPVARFNAWLDDRTERWVGLRHPVPVHITYRTAWVDSDGRDQFRADVYGRDARVFAAMVEAGITAPGS